MLGPDSILFIFNPYAIAAYASGVQVAQIGYEEYPELFTPLAAAQAGDYMVPLVPYLDERYDPDGDGARESVTVEGTWTEYGGFEDLTVRVGEQTCTVPDTWYFDHRAMWIHRENASDELAVEVSMENDYRSMFFVDLGGGVPSLAGQTDAAFEVMWDRDTERSSLLIPTDPERMILETRMNLLSTYSASRPYRLEESGLPAPLSDWYETDPATYFTLTTARELHAQRVFREPELPMGGDVVIPAGEALRIARTDGKEHVDLERADGSLVRVVLDVSDVPHRIAGEEESSWFEQLYYAG